MKSTLIFIICFILLASPAFAVKSWSFILVPDCDLCVEGMGVNTSLIVDNKGDEPLIISRLSLVDSTGIKFFTSPMQEEIVAGDSLTINFILGLPPATRGSTLFYKPCLELLDSEMCADDYTTMFIEPISRLDCVLDEHCEFDSRCENYKCVKFSCDGIAKNHGCQTFTFERIIQLLILVLLGILFFITLKRSYL